MIGFKVKFRNETIFSAIPDGSNSVIVGKRDNEFCLDICGMERETQTFFRWCYSEDLQLGEEIVVVVEDIKQISESMKPEQYLPYFSGNSDPKTRKKVDTHRLNVFYTLEKILKEEGLI